MSDRLATYLHDHYSGSTFAIELLKGLREQHAGEPHAGEPLSEFADGLMVEIEEDRKVLQRIIDRAGGEPAALKEAAAWLSERLSRFKLRRKTAGDFGTSEALETLALGIVGKLALSGGLFWRPPNSIPECPARITTNWSCVLNRSTPAWKSGASNGCERRLARRPSNLQLPGATVQFDGEKPARRVRRPSFECD